MKTLNILFFAVLVLFASCTKETEVIEVAEVNYEGVYLGKFDCTGLLSSENGEEFQITISKIEGESAYAIDFGDELIFTGNLENNQLVIHRQTINEDLGFDVVTMEGKVSFEEENIYSLDLFHKVDEEESSDCLIELTKV
ncbi:MAG: hypothetical protein HKO66_11395 [Saprospiraceae bacterium]|nr:hypothetical protein [Bacteroidia bacterium]NNE16781.1 hypothetical protein [Saprospiraceae bacterium]NNL92831.1 hypothetical protein [Saprospiraceae bacterium]